MNLDDALREDPEVTPISDPRVRFYLDNQQLIDTWALLRDEASSALHDRLLDLVDTLAADAELVTEDDTQVTAVDVDRGTPRIQVVRRNWVDATGTSPVAAIIEWNRALIDRRGDMQLYVGLRAKLSHPRAADLRGPLGRAGTQLQQTLGTPWRGREGRWPLWRWIRPAGGSLREQDLIAEARRELWRCWTASAPILDHLMNGEHDARSPDAR